MTSLSDHTSDRGPMGRLSRAPTPSAIKYDYSRAPRRWLDAQSGAGQRPARADQSNGAYRNRRRLLKGKRRLSRGLSARRRHDRALVCAHDGHKRSRDGHTRTVWGLYSRRVLAWQEGARMDRLQRAISPPGSVRSCTKDGKGRKATRTGWRRRPLDHTWH